MARGGRGYYAVPAGDDHTPWRADGSRGRLGDAAEDEEEEHDRVQLTRGATSSDRADSDSDEGTTTPPSEERGPPPSQAAEAVAVERPREERVDTKEERRGGGGGGAPSGGGDADNNNNNNDNNNDDGDDDNDDNRSVNQHADDSLSSSATTRAAPSSAEEPASSSSTSNSAPIDAEEEPLPAGAIRIRILDLNGKFFSIMCQLDWPVARLKDKVHEAAEVAVASQRLIYRGRVLEDEKKLDDYKLEDGHTVHLFVRMNAIPDADPSASEGGASSASGSGAGAGAGGPTLSRFGDDSVTIVHITSDTISSAVFPSDSARRVDPLMLDSPLGNCARRVKLWSSFLLIIYTMKVMGQFALLANDQQMRQEQAAKDDSNAQDSRYYDRYDYPPYYNQDPMVSALELMVHAFGVYVGCVGFKAAHDTDIRPIRFYCRGVVWLAFLTVLEQIYVTYQISESDYPETRIQYPYGPAAPSKDDIVSANIFQTIMLVVMWVVAIAHSYAHQAEVARYNESFAAAAMNAVPPAHLPEMA